MTTERLPTFFLSHGGGPWPYMKAELGHTYDVLEAALQDIPRQLGLRNQRPRAVLMISAHWEEAEFTLSSGAHPPMIYDYSGFPPYTYQVKYGAPGSPQLAAQVQQLLEQAGQPARLDPHRGFDHGTFAVMVPMYPDAEVPLVQLSLQAGYDPAVHLAAGRALAPLREQGVLIVGSGLSYHNLRQFGPAGAAPSRAFDAWLQHTVLESRGVQRARLLVNWADAPAARQAHPREDHLLPLMVAAGAAEDAAATRIYQDDFRGSIRLSSYRFD